MISRLWHGWTARGDADAYEAFLRDELFPRLDLIDGYRGGYVMRRAHPDSVEFATLTNWESIDAIKVFAGDDYETPVIEPEAARLLWHYQDHVAHFQTVVGAD
jgi:hypothetical protein